MRREVSTASSPKGLSTASPPYAEGSAVASVMADVCIDQAGVAFVPGEAFGAPGYARFSYALGDEDLVTGLERLQGLLGTK